MYGEIQNYLRNQLNEIREAASTGVLDGITTNPTLISKEGNTFEDQLQLHTSKRKG